MKKQMVLLSAIFLVTLLSACTTMAPADGMKVKCPACGHEFGYSESPER